MCHLNPLCNCSASTTVAYRPYTALTRNILSLSSRHSTKCAILIHCATVVLSGAGPGAVGAGGALSPRTLADAGRANPDGSAAGRHAGPLRPQPAPLCADAVSSVAVDPATPGGAVAVARAGDLRAGSAASADRGPAGLCRRSPRGAACWAGALVVGLGR